MVCLLKKLTVLSKQLSKQKRNDHLTTIKCSGRVKLICWLFIYLFFHTWTDLSFFKTRVQSSHLLTLCSFLFLRVCKCFVLNKSLFALISFLKCWDKTFLPDHPSDVTWVFSQPSAGTVRQRSYNQILLQVKKFSELFSIFSAFYS